MAERRIWAFDPEYYTIAKSMFHLRYSLLPYIYTMARVTFDTAVPLNRCSRIDSDCYDNACHHIRYAADHCRPLYYHWPEHDEAYAFSNCYMFGDALLCAPISSGIDPVSAMATTNVWFPPGVWYHYFTGQK